MAIFTTSSFEDEVMEAAQDGDEARAVSPCDVLRRMPSTSASGSSGAAVPHSEASSKAPSVYATSTAATTVQSQPPPEGTRVSSRIQRWHEFEAVGPVSPRPAIGAADPGNSDSNTGYQRGHVRYIVNKLREASSLPEEELDVRALVLAVRASVARAVLSRTARHAREIQISIAVREHWEIFSWRLCATWWVPHAMAWACSCNVCCMQCSALSFPAP